MFTSTIELFDQYQLRASVINAANFDRDLGAEVRERLEQLTYILARVRVLEETTHEAFRRSRTILDQHIENIENLGISFESVPAPPGATATQLEMESREQASFEMRLLTEAFYYFAGRPRVILINKHHPFPGLTNFESTGVRDTRNKLLEHAGAKGSPVTIRSFAWGSERGPVIKGGRYRGQENIFPDQGLYMNAAEFKANLEKLLSAALTADEKGS